MHIDSADMIVTGGESMDHPLNNFHNFNCRITKTSPLKLAHQGVDISPKKNMCFEDCESACRNCQ